MKERATVDTPTENCEHKNVVREEGAPVRQDCGEALDPADYADNREGCP